MDGTPDVAGSSQALPANLGNSGLRIDRWHGEEGTRGMLLLHDLPDFGYHIGVLGRHVARFADVVAQIVQLDLQRVGVVASAACSAGRPSSRPSAPPAGRRSRRTPSTETRAPSAARAGPAAWGRS